MDANQEKMLREVHEAVIGNPNTDTTGLIKRVKELEKYKESDKKLKNKVAGGLFVSVPIVGVVIEWFKHNVLHV